MRRQRSPLSALRSQPRSAFTLIELLVAMTIFVILATLTLGAYRGVTKDDRISAGAQQVKGWFEKARSMAIHAKQPRGIRFLPDQNNPRLCTSVAFIGGAGYEDGDLNTSLPLPDRKYLIVHTTALNYPSAAYNWPAGTILSPGGANSSNPGSGTTDPGYAGYASLSALYESGAFTDSSCNTHGLRIEIPRGSGMWYPVRWSSEDRNGNKVLDGGEDLNGNGALDPLIFLAKPLANYAQYAGLPLDYRLELGPTVLPDTANPLTRNVVIDLDASQIPWRPAFPATPPPSPVPYPGQMDVMFSPSGAFTGQIASSAGVMHLVISTLEDAEAVRAELSTHPANLSGTPPTSPPNYPFILADPVTPQRLVSVFLTSGRIAASNVFIPNSGDPTADGMQNTRAISGTGSIFECFTYALRGQEAK